MKVTKGVCKALSILLPEVDSTSLAHYWYPMDQYLNYSECNIF